MAVRETHILLDFMADADPLRDVNREINNTIRSTRDIARSYEGLTDASKTMMREMNRGWRNQDSAFLKYKNDLVAAEYGYYKLTQDTDKFIGKTDKLIASLAAVGLAHKKATDGMIANDLNLRRGFYRTIGTFANMTPQADRNRDALSRMNNPLYNANKAALGLVGNMARVANNANVSRVALEQLGANATMKELKDETRRLNQGLGAMPILYIAAGLGAYFFYGAMHKLAMGNEEYAASWKKMKATLREAIQPMVDVFIMIMVPIFNFITAIAEMIVKFNEAHPTIAKMIQGVLLLIPALTLLLMPLGLGIGYVAGLRLAFGFFFRMIAPFVTFMATMSATVWIVAAAVIGLAAAFIWAWNNVAWFRDGIIAAWDWIKVKTIEVFNAIKLAVMPALLAIVEYGKQKLAEFKAFWAENGAQILAIVKMYFQYIWSNIQMAMGIIKGIFQVVWPILVGMVKTSWAFIRLTIDNVLSIIKGIIKAGLALIRGDWDGAWQAIKGIAEDVWNNIKTFFQNLDLFQIGADILQGLIDGFGSMVGAVAKKVGSIVDTIKSAFTGAKALDIHSPSRLFHEYGINTFQGYNNGAMSEINNVERVIKQVASVPVEQAQSGIASTSTTSNSNRSVSFNPVIHVTGNNGDTGSVKQQVKEALDEMFDYVNSVYAVEGDY